MNDCKGCCIEAGDEVVSKTSYGDIKAAVVKIYKKKAYILYGSADVPIAKFELTQEELTKSTWVKVIK